MSGDLVVVEGDEEEEEGSVEAAVDEDPQHEETSYGVSSSVLDPSEAPEAEPTEPTEADIDDYNELLLLVSFYK